MKLFTKLDPDDAGYYYIVPEQVKDEKTFVAALAGGKCTLLVMVHKQAFLADPQIAKDLDDLCKAHIMRVMQTNQLIDAEEKAKTDLIKGS